MIDILSNNHFHFRKLYFEHYNYTNNLAGSPENYIAYMLKGNAKIVSQQNTIFIREKDLFFIPNKLPYESYWYGDNIEFLSIGFSSIESDEDIHFELQVLDCPMELKELITRIPANRERITCESLSIFYELLSKLLPYLEEKRSLSKKEKLLKKAQDYIKSNPDCSVADIAEYCYISEAYLFAIFKEKADCTPNDYRLRCKCAKVSEYLLTTDKTIEEISEKTGFSSASHLRRTLKKYTGLTPREIRKSRGF